MFSGTQWLRCFASMATQSDTSRRYRDNERLDTTCRYYLAVDGQDLTECVLGRPLLSRTVNGA